MNKYLEKIAVTTSKKDLPYRDRVEIVIVKDGKILLTRNTNKDTGDTWWGFPGGGTDGDSDVVACKKESLEEVGVAITNVKDLSITHTREGMNKKDNRHLKYRGSITRWFSADFEGIDKSVLGADNDSRKYAWQSPQEALQSLRRGKLMSVPRCKAIASLKPFKPV